MSKRGKSRPTEVQKISDPNFVLKVAVGPPLASLVTQAPGSGLTMGGQFCSRETRFIWRTAQLTADDNRIFDATGRLMAVSYHYGKNPYESLDPLADPTEEWDSICYIGGYNGMPNLKVRPKLFSLHGRQYIRDASGKITFCNIAQQSRPNSKHFAVFAGEQTERPVYTILVDMAGRTMQVMNARNERIALLQKPVRTLLVNAFLGVGSEFTIDVATGVDWTAMLAIVIGLHQVGKSLFKDAFNNFLAQPLQDEVTGYVQDVVAQTIEGIVEDEAAQAVEGDDGGNVGADGGGDGDVGGDYGGDGGGDGGDVDYGNDGGGGGGGEEEEEEGDGVVSSIISFIGELF